jgi:hypothetical protein
MVKQAALAIDIGLTGGVDALFFHTIMVMFFKGSEQGRDEKHH